MATIDLSRRYGPRQTARLPLRHSPSALTMIAPQAESEETAAEEAGMKTALVLLATVPAFTAMTGAASAQALKAGERAFRKCAACHEVGAPAKIKLGPPLNGIDGRKAGSFPGYHYSAANIESGIVWNEAIFKAYVRHPAQIVPGTKMMFAGIKDEKEIAALWAFLKQYDANGQKTEPKGAKNAERK